jgi:hypothetical protein
LSGLLIGLLGTRAGKSGKGDDGCDTAHDIAIPGMKGRSFAREWRYWQGMA